MPLPHERAAKASATHPSFRGLGKRDGHCNVGAPCRLSQLSKKRTAFSADAGRRVATLPHGNAAPEEPCMRAFPAHGSRTALSVLLTPVLPNCTSPSQAVTSLVHLIAETRAPNRRKTASFKLPFVEPKMNTCDNCTTRKSAPFPFRPGQISNPYAAHYRPPFAFSAFSCPLPRQLPMRVT